jgi:hypothetical protein
MPTVRNLVRSYQLEIQRTSDLMPERAAELLTKLTSLIGNCNDEIREADAIYAQHLLTCLESEAKANRAKIRAEISPEFKRRQEARDIKELVIELSRALKYYLRSKEEELQLARHQP